MPDLPKPRVPAAPAESVESVASVEVGDASGLDDSGSAGPVRSPAAGARGLVLRTHFYAGVLIAPFLVVAALTGLAYTFTPQLDRLVYGDKLFVDPAPADRPALPLSEQVAAARAAYPEGSLATVVTPAGPDRSTQVVLDVEGLDDERQRTVYVDPYDGRVLGELTTWWGSTPLTTWLDDLHRNLHLGAVGRNYSELAASWMWLVGLGGAWLWVARRRRSRRLRRVLAPDLAATGRRRTMAWHGSIGVWLVLGLLILSATGLTWSRYAGGNFSSLLDRLDAHAPEIDTTLPAPRPGSDTDTAAGSGDANHHGDGDVGAGSEVTGEARLVGEIDGVFAGARTAGLDGPVELAPPADAASAWGVTQTDRVWPVRLSRAAIDPADGSVVWSARWSDFPLLAQLSKLGVAAHMGELFGLANQVLLAALALGLLCVVVWGYRMWWQRRPTRDDRQARLGPPPARGAWRGVRRPVLAVWLVAAVAVGWSLPLLGLSLLAFLVLDAAVGAVRGRRRPRQPDRRPA